MPPVIPLYIFTARCTLVQSAVLRSHVVCPSVRLFVDCDHIGWNSSKIISRLVSMGRSLYEDLNIMDLLQGKQWTQSDPSPLIWASETFDRKLRPIAQRLQWRAYSEWCHRWPPPTTSPSSQNGGSICPNIRYGHISATGDPIHFMFGRRIEWRYFRSHQIQVGGRPPSWIISHGHFSATAHLIHLYIERIARSSLR